MRKLKWLLPLALALALSAGGAEAKTNTLTLDGIGTMQVPQQISFDKGAQLALPYMAEQGPKRFFALKGGSDAVYYTMTYSAPPDFTYGYAASMKLGIPFLQQIGQFSHRNDAPIDQLNLIADWMNTYLKQQGAVYDGDAPLKKVADKKVPHWEGNFVITTKENNITYHEAYTMVLQCDGYFTTMALFDTDADQKDVTAAVQKMVEKRKLPKMEKVLKL